MLRRYHVEFVDNDTHTIFHADTYTSLCAVDELVTMWGNCYPVITDLTDPDEGEPVDDLWLINEYAKAIALPVIVIMISVFAYWHKVEIAAWMSSLTH